MKTVLRHVLPALCVLAIPASVFAQGSIAGVVRDTSGAIMPGVTVEASSEALIEKSRSVTTDTAGQYRVVDLPPGEYAVAFSLSGFKTVRRPGVQLSGTFTAQVNVDLEVGSVEESITVAAESPTVDVVSNTTTFVASREVLDSIPTPVRNTPARALLIPGTTVTPSVLGQYNLTSHGSATSDFTMAIDGLRVNNLCGSGQFSGFYMNDAAIQELTYITGNEAAEIQSSGIRVNQVPKDGGNRFEGSMFFQAQGSGMQSDNRSDAVKAAGVRIAGTAYDWQINPAFGGPLAKDTLWFFGTYKYQNNKFYVPSAKFSDGSQAYRNAMGNYSAVARVTWQATSKDKIRTYIEKQYNGEYFNGFNTYATTTPEASTDAWGNGWIPQARWTRVQSSRLLIEAGIAQYNQGYVQSCSRTAPGGTTLATLNGSTGLLSGRCGYTIPEYSSDTNDFNILATVSYVTGSHALKFGVTDLWGENSRTFAEKADINTLITVNASATLLDVPFQAVVYNTPTKGIQHVNGDIGAFAQDAWTMKRLTLNYGARFDHFNASIPAESAAASTWIAARNFPEIKNVPNWNDWAVRLAASYDVTGDGKTALKVSAGKYVAAQAAGLAQTFNGMNGATQTRTWNDANGDKTIVNVDGSIQVNEVIGGTSNFGQITARPDAGLRRGYNWEYSAVLQRELIPRLAASAGYYRRSFYNAQVTDNQNVALSDWSTFSVVTPNDSRLPLSGQSFDMYTLSASRVGAATDNLITFSSRNRTTYDGLEFTANARGAKYLLFGGVTTDRRAPNTCDGDTQTNGNSPRDNPNFIRFCDSAPPFRTTVKLSAAYTLPYNIELSGTFAAIPGPDVAANYTVTSAIAGRPIIGSTTGAASTTINLAEPGTIFLDYQNRLDMRVGRTFRFGQRKIQGFMDVFNVLNAGTVTRVNTTYAASGTNLWMTPTSIIDGRYVRFGVQMNF